MYIIPVYNDIYSEILYSLNTYNIYQSSIKYNITIWNNTYSMTIHRYQILYAFNDFQSFILQAHFAK